MYDSHSHSIRNHGCGQEVLDALFSELGGCSTLMQKPWLRSMLLVVQQDTPAPEVSQKLHRLEYAKSRSSRALSVSWTQFPWKTTHRELDQYHSLTKGVDWVGRSHTWEEAKRPRSADHTQQPPNQRSPINCTGLSKCSPLPLSPPPERTTPD